MGTISNHPHTTNQTARREVTIPWVATARARYAFGWGWTTMMRTQRSAPSLRRTMTAIVWERCAFFVMAKKPVPSAGMNMSRLRWPRQRFAACTVPAICCVYCAVDAVPCPLALLICAFAWHCGQILAQEFFEVASATAALALCSLLNGGQLVAQLRQAAHGARFLEISLTGKRRQALICVFVSLLTATSSKVYADM